MAGARRLVGARIGLIVGGLLGLVITPPFAWSYYPANEVPPGWLDALSKPFRSWGVFDGSAVATYTRYGKLFGVALLIVLVSALILVGGRAGTGRRERRAWFVTLVGFGLATLGTFGDYALPQGNWWASTGFGFELLGFLGVAVGTVLLGLAWRRERGLSVIRSTGVALLGPVSVTLGTAIVTHIPSGSASLLLVAAVVAGATGVVDGQPTA